MGEKMERFKEGANNFLWEFYERCKDSYYKRKDYPYLINALRMLLENGKNEDEVASLVSKYFNITIDYADLLITDVKRFKRNENNERR